MNEEKMSVNSQIRKLIKASTCHFRLCGDILNVVKVDKISILSHHQGDYGEWNTEYKGCASLTVPTKEGGGFTKFNYDIVGKAYINNEIVEDIDKTITVYK